MNKIQKVLEQFGLTENETKVYLEVLRHDYLSPFQIAKLTDIPRTTIYDIIMSLSLKGIIELKQSKGFEKQQTLIRAKNPSILRKILQDKRKDLSVLELNIMGIISDLKKDFHRDNTDAFVKFYEGIEGAKKIMYNFRDIDLPCYGWCYLTPADAFGSDVINEYVQNELKSDDEKRNRQKLIIPYNEWTRHVVTYQYSKNSDYIKIYEFRYIDNPSFEVNEDISVQGNIIQIMSAKDDEIWGLEITSNLLAQTMISFHHLMWNMATPITEEVVKSWGSNEIIEAEKDLISTD
ncbi:MAG: helix-turn-helix domain-containing protein [bacterium]